MAGLVPAIHVLELGKKIVDARHKAGHDKVMFRVATPHARHLAGRGLTHHIRGQNAFGQRPFGLTSKGKGILSSKGKGP
jgi:hypothetical protein